MKPIFLALGLLALGGLAQESPHYFELLLPDFYERPFSDSQQVIDLPPGKPLKNMGILVVKAYERELNYGGISIKINGKGMGNAFEQRGTANGTLLAMNEFSLGMRPDNPIDPMFEYSIEVAARSRSGSGNYYQSWLLRENSAYQNRLFAYTTTLGADSKSVPADVIVRAPAAPPVLRAVDRAGLKVHLEGEVSGGAGVKLTLNSAPVALKGNAFAADIAVTPATKELLLEASHPQGGRRGVVIPVYVQQPAPPKMRFAGKRYAVVIGVSDYGSGKQALPKLSAAATDADLLAQALVKSGFPQANVRLLRDDQANKQEMRLALTEFASKAEANDLFLLYVAAHGLHDPARAQQLYLAPHGAQSSQLAATAFPLEEVKMMLDRGVKSRNAVFILDTSHSLTKDLDIPGKNLVNQYALNLFAEEGRSVLVSAATGQPTLASRSAPSSSLFAEQVAAALSGGADLNLDRIVTAEEFCRFVAERVRQASNGEQTPRFLLASAGRQLAIAEPVLK